MTMIEDRLDTDNSCPKPYPSDRRALLAIRRYWYLVLICAVLAGGAGAVYAFKRPPVYTASSRLAALSVNNFECRFRGRLAPSRPGPRQHVRPRRPELSGHSRQSRPR